MTVIRPPLRWTSSILGFAAFLLGALVMSVADAPVLVRAPFATALVVLALWCLIRFPRVAVHEEADHLRVVGPFKTHRVPWHQIERFDLSETSSLLLKDGTRVPVTAVSYGGGDSKAVFGDAVATRAGMLDALIERHRQARPRGG